MHIHIFLHIIYHPELYCQLEITQNAWMYESRGFVYK